LLTRISSLLSLARKFCAAAFASLKFPRSITSGRSELVLSDGDSWTISSMAAVAFSKLRAPM
jgi:hypothetical protein